MIKRTLNETEIKKITDQGVLFDIAKNSDNCTHRYAAIRVLTDQDALYDIVNTDGNYAIRAAAVEQITRQDFLSYIAQNDNDEYVRQAAVERLDDQDLLAKIAKHDIVSQVCLEATKRITDQVVLAYIASHEEDYDFICETAIEQIDDQTLLVDVTQKAYFYNVRLTAAEMLTDQAVAQNVYLDIASNNDYDCDIRMKAAIQVNDQSLVQNVYADVAKNTDYSDDYEPALQRLTDQKLLADVVKNGRPGEARWTALAKITDQMLLADIAINNEIFHKYNPSCNCGFCQHDGVYYRLSAVRKISDQAALAHVVKNSKYGDVRFIAVTKLSDVETLDCIAKNDEDSIVCNVASERLANHVTHDAEKENSKIFATKNQNESIQFAGLNWRVLDSVDGMALLLSNKILTRERYHTREKIVTWGKSDLREYLNGSFYETTFNAKEKAQIIETKNQNLGSPLFGMAGGNDTFDKIFLLSLEEVVRYFGNSGQIYYGHYDNSRSISDEFNANRKAELDFHEYYKRLHGNEYRPIASTWWLRSPVNEGFDCATAAIVYENGGISVGGNAVFCTEGVRPALWLKLK